MLELDDIPMLSGPRPEGARRAARRAPHAKAEGVARRSMLGGALAAGTAVGLSTLGVFSPARKALSDGFTLKATTYYDIYGRCPSYAAPFDCSPGCGPSAVVSSACRTSGKYKGFHRSGVSDPGRYKLRPNQCYAGHYDGWIWAYAHKCGNCKKSVTWRCHDGWKKSAAGHWYKSVCRWAVACKS
jgi:hypothetical protein